MKERIVVAMSGGVDSSVAAALLCEQGYEPVGVTLHLWDASGSSRVGRCCAPEDRDDARRVCDHLGIAHHTIDERELFRTTVVAPFVDAYAHGITPAPCVVCNQNVKLARLVALADLFGSRSIATGHYARVEAGKEGNAGNAGNPKLLRGADQEKDQSYFLYGASQEQLRRLVFPLGHLRKSEVREQGRRLGVPNADKPDSQELCFVPDGDVASFVGARAAGAMRPGRIVDAAGGEVGAHAGVHGFTIGQRKGLGLGGGTEPRYVLRIVPERDEVVVGDERELYGAALSAVGASWPSGRPDAAFRAEVRVRHRHAPAAAWVTPTADGFAVRFDVAQRAIAPGQAAVAYVGEEVVVGGIISAAA